MDTYHEIANYLNGVSDRRLVPKWSGVEAGEGSRTQEVSSKVRIPGVDEHVRARVPWCDSLLRLAEEGAAAGFVENLVVHGSWGDLTFNAYSDLDLTIFLRRDLVHSSAANEALRRWVHKRVFPLLYAVDPLQHHGPFFLWPELADRYDQRILPVSVYTRSWAAREQQVAFRSAPVEPVDDPTKALSVRTLERLVDAESRFFASGYHMYAVKRYLSNLMLVPALYCADTGRPVHKAESFDAFYVEFGELGNCIRVASDMRRAWGTALGPAWTLFARGAHHLPEPALRGVRFLWRNPALRDRLREDVESGVPALMRRVCERLAS